jgi:hypothetical protein
VLSRHDRHDLELRSDGCKGCKPPNEALAVGAREEVRGPNEGPAEDHGADQHCTVGNRVAAGHLKNPKAPPGPTNDIAHWTVNKGKPGLDEPGDSIAIEGAKHKSISIKVTAPAGTVLHFICAVHPWMQGTIKVT